MHESIIIGYIWREVTFGVGSLGLPGSSAYSCVYSLYIHMWQASVRSSPGLMLGLLVLSSHDGACSGRRSPLFQSDLFFGLDVLHRRTYTSVSEDRRVRSGVLHQGSGGAHLILKFLEPPSHTLPRNAHK